MDALGGFVLEQPSPTPRSTTRLPSPDTPVDSSAAATSSTLSTTPLESLTGASPADEAASTLTAQGPASSSSQVTGTESGIKGLDKEVQNVMAGLGSFWGRVRKQGTAALATAEKQLESTRKDLTPLVSKARANLDSFSESTKAELQRLSEASAQPHSGVMIGADGVPVILDQVEPPREDKGKGVDRSGSVSSSDASQNPAAAASAFFSKVHSQLASNANVQDLGKNLSSLSSNLTTNLSSLQNQLAHLDLGESSKVAEDYLHKGETWFAEFTHEVGRLANDAVKVVPPIEAEPSKSLTQAEQVALGRREMLLYKLRTDSSAFFIDPAQPPPSSSSASPFADAASTPQPDTRESFSRFLQSIENRGGFEGPTFTAQVEAERAAGGEALEKTWKEVVREGGLSNEAFWVRYLFRVRGIEEEEERRRRVLQDAQQDDEDFSWDMDDEENGPAPTSPPTAQPSTVPSTIAPSPAAAPSESTTPASVSAGATTPRSNAPEATTVPSTPQSLPLASPRASSDGTSSYDVVGEKSGNPSVDGDADADAEETTVERSSVTPTKTEHHREEEEDSDWE
ncbi:hypothetical protein JCM21900_004721 [Sporobolomyces salmonicolor]